MGEGMEATAHQEQAIVAARFSARALVTVCAAILALVISGERNPYQEAVSELNKLLELDYREILNEYVITANPTVKQQIDTLRKIFADNDLALSVKSGNVLLTRTSVQNSLMSVRAPSGYELGLVNRDITTPNNAVSGAVSNIASVEHELRQFLEETRTQIPASVDRVWLDFDRPRTGAVAYVRWGGGRAELGEISGEIGAMDGSIDFESPLNWLEVLRDYSESADLVGQAGDLLYFLPKCKDARVWDRVRNRSAQEARTFLADLANAPGESTHLDIKDQKLTRRIGAETGLNVHADLHVKRQFQLAKCSYKSLISI